MSLICLNENSTNLSIAYKGKIWLWFTKGTYILFQRNATYNEMIQNIFRSTICSTKQVCSCSLLFFFVKMHLMYYVIGTWRTYLSILTQKCNLHQFVYHYLPNHETRTLQLVLIWTRNATWPFLSQLAFSIKKWENLIWLDWSLLFMKTFGV